MEKTKLTYDETKEKALSLLSFAANTEAELYKKLISKGADEADARDVIEFCREYGLLCDAEYALKKTRDLVNLKKLGRRRIVQELRAKGLGEEDIEYALSSVQIPDEPDLADVEKKLGGDFEKKNRDKVIRYFVQRGYDLYAVVHCIERIIDNEV